MSKKNILFFVIAMGTFSCSTVMHKTQWHIVYAKGIIGDNLLFNYLYFISNNKVILLGSQSSDEDVINKRYKNINSVICLSGDGGYSWMQNSLGKGEVSAFLSRKESMFVAIQKISNSVVIADSTLIYLSKDDGKQWVEVSKLDNFLVRNLFQLSGNKICLVGKINDETFWTVKVSKDNGRSWNDIGAIPNDISSPVVLDDVLYCLSVKDKKSILTYNLITGSTGKVDLQDLGINAYLLAKSGNGIYLAGMTKDALDIYEFALAKEKINHIVSIKEKVFPKDIFSINNAPAVIIGDRNSIGVVYSLYFKDKNNQWVKDNIPSSYFQPYAFCANSIWGYNYDGKFYVRNLNEE